MCTVLLPPGDNPIAVNKYISYHIYIIPETRAIVFILDIFCFVGLSVRRDFIFQIKHQAAKHCSLNGC